MVLSAPGLHTQPLPCMHAAAVASAACCRPARLSSRWSGHPSCSCSRPSGEPGQGERAASRFGVSAGWPARAADRRVLAPGAAAPAVLPGDAVPSAAPGWRRRSRRRSRAATNASRSARTASFSWQRLACGWCAVEDHRQRPQSRAHEATAARAAQNPASSSSHQAGPRAAPTRLSARSRAVFSWRCSSAVAAAAPCRSRARLSRACSCSARSLATCARGT